MFRRATGIQREARKEKKAGNVRGLGEGEPDRITALASAARFSGNRDKKERGTSKPTYPENYSKRENALRTEEDASLLPSSKEEKNRGKRHPTVQKG